MDMQVTLIRAENVRCGKYSLNRCQGQTPQTLALAQGSPVASAMPIIATLLWCVLFIVIAVWRFNREEF
jgi:hypothetical protein